MSLLDTVERMNSNATANFRRRNAQEIRRRRGNDRGIPGPDGRSQRPPSVPSFGTTSYHDSRYAGNESDQGRAYPMPPPLSVGYDMREVLARLHNTFLENRQRFHEMRARQVAMFQAVHPPQATPEQPNQPPPATPPGGPAPPGGAPGTGEQPPNIGPNPQPGPPSAGGGFGGSSGFPITGHPTYSDVLNSRERLTNRNPILWGN